MISMDAIKNAEVAKAFKNYPKPVREKLLFLRQLVLETASQTDDVSPVEETLKWGEPSYVTKSGSTVRMDWKKARPHEYALYFHCQTRLVDTFKELYSDEFRFEGNRAIVFHESDHIPIDELKHCILMALTYHRRKHLPMLGA
jgi:hypothetical protein